MRWNCRPVAVEEISFVFVLPKRLVCPTAPAAITAAVCVMATWIAGANYPAAAQSRLEAEYIASVSGIPIGRGNWVIEVTDDQFRASANGATWGLLRVFSNARGISTSRGVFSGGQAMATDYAATIDYNRVIDDVHMVLAGGNVKDYSVEPPPQARPDRIPITDADRRGVNDPMTSAISRVGGTGDVLSPDICNRKIAVFDGRVRYDLSGEYKRMETVKADKGYEGPVVVCAIYFKPIAGYVPDRQAIKYLVAQRDAEVWLAPIGGTRVLVPFRVSVPTPIGKGVLQATEFVSVAHSAHSTAKTQ